MQCSSNPIYFLWYFFLKVQYRSNHIVLLPHPGFWKSGECRILKDVMVQLWTLRFTVLEWTIRVGSVGQYGLAHVASSTSECCYFNASHHTVGQARNRNLEWHVGCLQWYCFLPKVSSMMLLTTNITLSILKLAWQQTMLRQCCSRLKQNSNQCLAQQIVTWFQITWQSSCGTRDSRNILISTFGLKLPNSTLYELHGKKRLF